LYETKPLTGWVDACKTTENRVKSYASALLVLIYSHNSNSLQN
jgi:hypothetical protein